MGRQLTTARQALDRPPHWRGVTLVEFIVAVGLLAFVFVFMFQLLPYSHVVDHEAWNMAVARDIAHTEMETLRQYQIDYLYAIPATGATTDPRTQIQYTWTITQSPYPLPAPCPPLCPACPTRNNLQAVTVQVNWTEPTFGREGLSGVPKTIVTQSLIARTLPPTCQTMHKVGCGP